MNQNCRIDDAGSLYSSPPPNQVMRRSFRQLSSDFITLAELQAELLKVDLKDWSQGVVRAVIVGLVALVILLASMPVLLISLGYFIAELTALTTGVSMLIAAGAGLVTAAICGGAAFWSLKRDQGVLQRFSIELRKNVRWLKDVLNSPAARDKNSTA